MFPKIIYWYAVEVGTKTVYMLVLDILQLQYKLPFRVMQAILFITYEYTECILNILNNTARHIFGS
jgi:hypothetical protein